MSAKLFLVFGLVLSVIGFELVSRWIDECAKGVADASAQHDSGGQHDDAPVLRLLGDDVHDECDVGLQCDPTSIKGHRHSVDESEGSRRGGWAEPASFAPPKTLLSASSDAHFGGIRDDSSFSLSDVLEISGAESDQGDPTAVQWLYVVRRDPKRSTFDAGQNATNRTREYDADLKADVKRVRDSSAENRRFRPSAKATTTRARASSNPVRSTHDAPRIEERFAVHQVEALTGYFAIPPGVREVVVEVGANAEPEWMSYAEAYSDVFLVLVEPLVSAATLEACRSIGNRCAVFAAAVSSHNGWAMMSVSATSYCSSLLSQGTACATVVDKLRVPVLTLDTVLAFVPPYLPVHVVAFDCQGVDLLAASSLRREKWRVANIVWECQDLPLHHPKLLSPLAFNCGQTYSCLVAEAGWVATTCRRNFAYREFNCVAYNPHHAMRSTRLLPIASSALRSWVDQSVDEDVEFSMPCPVAFRRGGDGTTNVATSARLHERIVAAGIPLGATGYLLAGSGRAINVLVAVGNAAIGAVLRRPPRANGFTVLLPSGKACDGIACQGLSPNECTKLCLPEELPDRRQPKSRRPAEKAARHSTPTLDQALGYVPPRNVVTVWISSGTALSEIDFDSPLQRHTVSAWVFLCKRRPTKGGRRCSTLVRNVQFARHPRSHLGNAAVQPLLFAGCRANPSENAEPIEWEFDTACVFTNPSRPWAALTAKPQSHPPRITGDTAPFTQRVATVESGL